MCGTVEREEDWGSSEPNRDPEPIGDPEDWGCSGGIPVLLSWNPSGFPGTARSNFCRRCAGEPHHTDQRSLPRLTERRADG